MSRGGKRKYDKSVYRSLALITQFGINMLVPIGMLTALGIWLDGKLDTSYWTVLLFFVGAIAGGQNVYRMARAVYAPDREKESDRSKADRSPGPDGGKTDADSNRGQGGGKTGADREPAAQRNGRNIRNSIQNRQNGQT